MSPPQVSGLVAMAMPQQKEACVWGPVPGRRGGQGTRREGALLAQYTPHFSLARQERGREEIESDTQNRLGLSAVVTLKMSLKY